MPEDGDLYRSIGEIRLIGLIGKIKSAVAVLWAAADFMRFSVWSGLLGRDVVLDPVDFHLDR